MSHQKVNRRGFIGALSLGAAVMGISIITSPLKATVKYNWTEPTPDDPDGWFDQIKGRHRIVFDARQLLPSPWPFAWPLTFLMANNATGAPDKNCGVVMVLRHEAILYALGNTIWKKYKIGEMFKINDPVINTPVTRNPFWKPSPGVYKIPGIGDVKIGINELRERGVLFCACDASLARMSAMIAGKIHADPAAIRKEWEADVLPGIRLVPSGVWALGRAQEHRCAYCLAG